MATRGCVGWGHFLGQLLTRNGGGRCGGVLGEQGFDLTPQLRIGARKQSGAAQLGDAEKLIARGVNTTSGHWDYARRWYRTVESVLLPRGGLCVSSQVGCAVGCVFCMTGLGGLERQLGSAEIVAQVALARSLRPVTKVVFMGMGEPAHNLDAVLEAIDLLGTGGGLGHKNLVFSTVGDRRAFERLPQGRVKPALALSLHSTDAALRARLLPRAPAIAPDELVALGDAYARATGYPMQVQWTLLDGINDRADEIDGLVRLLAGKLAVLNLIPYNTVDGLALARPAPDRARAMVRALQRRGVLTKLRQSAGQDVQAGCGQLRARHELGERRVAHIAQPLVSQPRSPA
jgi:23S rRNA (adenine2503-C2)-methyltransferase